MCETPELLQMIHDCHIYCSRKEEPLDLDLEILFKKNPNKPKVQITIGRCSIRTWN